MSRSYPTAPAKCGPAEKPAGGLPGLVRPRFFPGQRLTDGDLTATIEWVRTRFALDGLRGGWGVVCGLGVSASRSAEGKPTVTVDPGFAIDANGNPLVVNKLLEKEVPRTDRRNIGDCSLSASSPSPSAKLTVGPYEGQDPSRWAVFDLLLCPDETEAEPVAAGCRPVGYRCEATRTRKGAKLEWVHRPWSELSPPTPHANDDPGAAFLKRFQTAVPQAFKLPDPGLLPDTAGAVRAWLEKQLTESPELGRTFPDLAEWLKKNGDRELSTPWGVARLLFWMADAARRVPIACPEPGECPESGVPLARVWVEADGSFYAIRYIDTAPPGRRQFEPHASSGHATADYLGWRSRDALVALARLGIAATAERFEIPADASQLLEVFKTEPDLAPSVPVVVRVSDPVSAPVGTAPVAGTTPDPLGDRVVGFRAKNSPLGPLLKVPARLDVQLFPAAKAEPKDFAFDVRPGGLSLVADALPVGGWVTVVVDPAKLEFAIGKMADHAFWYHDDIQGKLISPTGVPADGKVIVGTFQIPTNTALRADIRVTLLVGDKSAPTRIIAVSGRVGGDSQPLQVAQVAPTDAPPTMVVTPYKATKLDPGQTVIVLQSGQEHKLPLTVHLSTPGLTGISGKLRAASAKPEEPTAGQELGTIRQELWKKGSAPERTVVSIAAPTTGDPVWFWLTGGRDDFHQPFVIHPALKKVTDDSGERTVFAAPLDPAALKFQVRKVNVAVKNDTADGKAILTLSNNEDKPITLTAVVATQLVAGATEQKLTLPDPDVNADASVSFDLVAKDKTSPWRVVVSFKPKDGADTEAVTGALDVTL